MKLKNKLLLGSLTAVLLAVMSFSAFLKRSAMLSRRMNGLNSTVVYPPSAEALRLSSKTVKKRRCDAIGNKDHC